jgi:putative ABC transport system permease protein
MHSFIFDLRSGLRSLARRPALTFSVALILALGIGATTAIFSVVEAVLLKPLPYAAPERLVVIWGNFLKLKMERMSAKPSEYVDYRDKAKSFSEVAAYQNQDLTLAGDPEPERILGARVTASLFPLLGAPAAIGRVILPEDGQPGQELIAVLSHGLWRRRFGGDPQIVGKTLKLGNANYSVIGVMPEGFEFPHPSFPSATRADLWIPLVFTPEQTAAGQGRWEYRVIARLKDGVSLEAAQTEMSAMALDFEEHRPGYRGPNNMDGGWRITVASLKEEISGSSRRSLLILFGIAGLVLLAACTNVAMLLLMRATARSREFAMRSALGASRPRLVRQLLTESLMLAIPGGAAGLLIAFWSIESLIAFNPDQLPRLSEAQIDLRAFAFAFALTLAAAVICGLIPAWNGTGAKVQAALYSGGSDRVTGRARIRSILIVAEIAIAVCAMVAAGLLLRSLARLERVDPGFNRHQLLTFELAPPTTKYADAPQIADFYSRLLARLESLPGVSGVGMSSIRPLSGTAIDDPFSIEGRPLDPNRMTVAGRQTIGPQTLQVLGVPLLRGREFTAADAQGAPAVAIINDQLARRHFPEENPLGKRMKLGGPRAPGDWAEIVGVVGDIPHRSLESEPQPDWYRPQAQAPTRRMHVFLRTTGDPLSLAAAARSEVLALDRDLPVVNLETLDQTVAETLAPRRFNVLLAALFAVVALALSASGIYSVTSYTVTERTREIGIRMALGAEARDVLRMVIRQGMLLASLGVIFGLGAAFALARLMASLLYGIGPSDPATYGGIVMLLLLIGLVACYLPARRATRVDPLVALRYE